MQPRETWYAQHQQAAEYHEEYECQVRRKDGIGGEAVRHEHGREASAAAGPRVARRSADEEALLA